VSGAVKVPRLLFGLFKNVASLDADILENAAACLIVTMTTDVMRGIQQIAARDDYAPRQRSAVRDERSSSEAGSVSERPKLLITADDTGLIDNPLLQWGDEEDIKRRAQHFAEEHGLRIYKDVFVQVCRIPIFAWNAIRINCMKAGKILRDPEAWDSLRGLTTEEKAVLEHETISGFWKQPKQLQVTIITLCVAAIVQGWNQTGTNGANLNWPQQFGLAPLGSDPTGNATWIFALVNAATYFSASLVGCWISDPLNEYFFGRRAAICISAIIILASVIGGACTSTWQGLLVCRIVLGIGMGCKASVVPVFAAEVAPSHIRGSLVMNWQLFDAFGIFLGFTANLAVSHISHTAWRWQIASSVLPTIVLLSLIYVGPESPRFLM